MYQETIFEGLTGNQLIDSLVVHYKPASVLNYDNARDLMFSEIYNVDGINICVYTGDTIEIPFGHSSPRSIANSHDPAWNTEHIYPQSKGAGSGNARSDLHHLMPTRADVNSSRGNSPFGYVPDEFVTNWWNEDGSTSTAPEGDTGSWSKAMGSSRFEPRDAVKGNLARAVFYFYTMYQAEAIAADPAFFEMQYEALREFHNNDPVDQLEVDRSNQKAMVQDGKPNPFVLDTTLVRRAFFENFEFPDLSGNEEGYFVDFEDASKPGYAESFISLNGITWKLDNVLIGTAPEDMKFGTRSARARHQTSAPVILQMEDDITDGLGTFSFYYSRADFSGDRDPVAPQLVAEYSLDEGDTWIQIGPDIDLTDINELTLFEASVNEPGSGRIRIRSVDGSNGRRFNIDNIQVTNYIETDAEITITGREGWRMLSSPIESVKLSTFLAGIFTQGFPGADVETGSPNVYLFNEEEFQFEVPDDITHELESGTGLIVYLYENDDRDESVTGNLSRNIELSGREPNSFMFPLSFTDNGTPQNEGWNLVGNPFNTALSVSELELTLEDFINNNVYVWDANAGTNGEYVTLSSGDINHSFAPFQGFWVKTESAGQEFPFTKDAATDNGTFFKEAGEPVEISIVFDGNFKFGDLRLILSEDGSTGFTNHDGYSLVPLEAEHAYSYFIKNGRQLSRVYLPAAYDDVVSIPLSIDATVNLDGFLKLVTDSDLQDYQFVVEESETGHTWNLLKETIPIQMQANKSKTSPLQPSIPVHAKSKSGSKFILHIYYDESSDLKTELPNVVELSQNYPNPFNPGTVIEFHLPSEMDVRLEVFDLLGRRVALLADEHMQAGSHQVSFNASSLASGIYIYRLTTPGRSDSRRMALIK